jgi:hypothetical protein
MSRQPPCWSSDATSATVLMEFLSRASPEFVAVELEKLGLLEAADRAAARALEEVRLTALLRTHRITWRMAMVTLATCAMIVAIAETWHLGAMLPDDSSRFMQLAGPTPEW